jgi:hypothetical protein
MLFKGTVEHLRGEYFENFVHEHGGSLNGVTEEGVQYYYWDIMREFLAPTLNTWVYLCSAMLYNITSVFNRAVPFANHSLRSLWATFASMGQECWLRLDAGGLTCPIARSELRGSGVAIARRLSFLSWKRERKKKEREREAYWDSPSHLNTSFICFIARVKQNNFIALVYYCESKK